MTRAILALIAVSLAVTLSACGGQGDEGDGSPRVRLLLEADLSGLPAGGDPEEVMRNVAQILERRATEFGVAQVNVEPEAANRLSVTLQDVGSEDARQLIVKTALLGFRQPVLDDDGQIVCEAPDGSIFSAPYNPQTQQDFTVDRDAGQLLCPTDTGMPGNVLWEPATATDSLGGKQALTGRFLQPNGARVVSAPSPVVSLDFNFEGRLLLEEITTRLVGLPLGIFLDEGLLMAPTVVEPVPFGNVVIAGLSLHEARLLAAQLSAGALPVPLREISVEENP